MTGGRDIAPALPVLEVHVKIVDVGRSAMDPTDGATEASEDDPDWPFRLHVLRHDGLARDGGAPLRRGQRNPQLEDP